MGQEQDQPYEEAGLIDHGDEDDKDENDTPAVEQERQRMHGGGATERISEEVIERIPRDGAGGGH
jgi:hypothetical protein